MHAISKLMGGMSSAYRLPHEVSDGPVSGDELKQNLDGRLEKLRGRGTQPQVCYEVATHAARAGNAITKEAEKALNREKNYSPGYLELMNIHDDTRRFHFNSNDIKESGFLNFERRNSDDVVHTAYVHRDSEGSLLLAHNNCHDLDVQMSSSLELKGGANVYDITSGKDSDLNRYLDRNGLNFFYTPASVVNAKAR